MLLPGRHANTGDYRYGFQGQELDNEIKGEGNSYDFGARMLDPRVGRWFARDPLEKKYPYITPYSFAGNSPLQIIDVGGEKLIKIVIKDKSGFIKGDIELVIDEEIKDKVFALLDYVIANKIKVHFNSDFRSSANQKAIQKTGTTPAKVGTSRHEAGFALDFNLYNDNGKIIKNNKTITTSDEFIKGAKKLGFRWGGEFSKPDRIHIDAWAKGKVDIYGYKDFSEAYIENQGQTDIETVIYEYNRKETNTDNSLGKDDSSWLTNVWDKLFGTSSKDSQVTSNVTETYELSYVNTKTTGLRFYGEPTASSHKSLLPKGTLIFSTGKTENGRTEVRTIKGNKGWVSSKYVKKVKK